MNHELPWVAERVRVFRESDPEFARWARGHGPITHNDLTQLRVHDLAQVLVAEGKASDTTAVYRTLWSADRLAVAGMWLTVHMTYADRVYPDGREMRAEDFKETPEGHTGGALNIVPAYVGYLAANALSGLTRGWLMGQGHCVAGIDACNLLVGNMTPGHAERYDRSESGLTRFARDFYSYAIDAQGRPASPLGSHVGPNTAGGLSEGGYLGFAELQYVHMPFPGERPVAFLRDVAFDEPPGTRWALRWWRSAHFLFRIVCCLLLASDLRFSGPPCFWFLPWPPRAPTQAPMRRNCPPIWQPHPTCARCCPAARCFLAPSIFPNARASPLT